MGWLFCCVPDSWHLGMSLAIDFLWEVSHSRLSAVPIRLPVMLSASGSQPSTGLPQRAIVETWPSRIESYGYLRNLLTSADLDCSTVVPKSPFYFRIRSR
jgi:hypothetical protein